MTGEIKDNQNYVYYGFNADLEVVSAKTWQLLKERNNNDMQ